MRHKQLRAVGVSVKSHEAHVLCLLVAPGLDKGERTVRGHRN